MVIQYNKTKKLLKKEDGAQGSYCSLERCSIRPRFTRNRICRLTFDQPESSANVFDRKTLKKLNHYLDVIEKSDDIQGVIFASAKDKVFIAGADLKTMAQDLSPEKIKSFIKLGQETFARISRLQVPTIAAINGACLGGGLELSLACDYRICSPEKSTKLGLPETMLGILPAWGGSSRLPKLIGLPQALKMILTGKLLNPKKALKINLIDQIVPRERLIEVADSYILRFHSSKSHSSLPKRKSHFLTNNPLAAMAIKIITQKKLLAKTQGKYPALLKALHVACHASYHSIPYGMKLEQGSILELIQTSECKNLMRLFFLREKSKKLTFSSSQNSKIEPVQNAAVIGAGVMGSGIVHWLTSKSIPTLMRDIDNNAISRGLKAISNLYKQALKRRILSKTTIQQALDKITPSTSLQHLEKYDIVIEAAVEKMELKKKIFQELEQHASSNTILATNTSALSITTLSKELKHPERLVGIHFFNPVHRMPLVEVIYSPVTSPEVINRALRFVQSIGKLPVLIKDSPGFIVNRILVPYLVEVGHLVDQGTPPHLIDQTMLSFGMPMGPVRLLDEVGVDVSLHVAETLHEHFSQHKIPELLYQMVNNRDLGKKTNRGFYLYSTPQRKIKSGTLNPKVRALQTKPQALKLSHNKNEIMERLNFLMINEALKCLEEKIVASPEDIDFAMIMGTGYAPFTGGPLRFAQDYGLPLLSEKLTEFESRFGPQYKPSQLLIHYAKKGNSIYEK